MPVYTPEEIAETYKRMDDNELIKFASTQARTLRKDIVIHLKKEIASRGLDTSLLSWIDSEVQDYVGLERDSLLGKIKGVRCPNCNIHSDLRGYEFNRVTSYVISYSQKRYTKILCDSCGKKEKWSTIGSNFLVGWWSKSGFFMTPFLIIKDLCNFLFIQKISSKIFEELIDANTGYFRRNGIDNGSIIEVINTHNFIKSERN